MIIPLTEMEGRYQFLRYRELIMLSINSNCLAETRRLHCSRILRSILHHICSPMSLLMKALTFLPGFKNVLALYQKYSPGKSFISSASYWEERYLSGGNSGPGSYGKLAQFKAEVINEFVASENVSTVIEFGCGDGNQLLLANYPHYIGVDISLTAIAKCRQLFSMDKSKSFIVASRYAGERADLAMSLDVIFHLVEDAIFADYMNTMFAAAVKYVIIYSSNFDGEGLRSAYHVRHRKFTDWIEANYPSFKLTRIIKNRFPFQGNESKESFADFYIYKLSD